MCRILIQLSLRVNGGQQDHISNYHGGKVRVFTRSNLLFNVSMERFKIEKEDRVGKDEVWVVYMTYRRPRALYGRRKE